MQILQTYHHIFWGSFRNIPIFKSPDLKKKYNERAYGKLIATAVVDKLGVRLHEHFILEFSKWMVKLGGRDGYKHPDIYFSYWNVQEKDFLYETLMAGI